MELERVPVDVIGCSKTYADGTRGLLATTLAVEAGEVLALLGPSGCGKSTTLAVLAGLQRPDAGSMRIDDVDVLRSPPEHRPVGLVLQKP
ncbi:MAG: ATP-binding cassette domain-containing protein, partial [Gammaproteobacteria bacterium]|nr:ATP-binding cassette domain-containing protein [Gammaproteobacteria bacterium]